MKEDSAERNAVKHEFFYQLDLLLLWLVYFQLAWMIAFLQLRRHLPSQELQKSPRWWNLKRELQKFGQNVTNFVWLWLWAWQLGGRFIGYSFWRKQIRIVWYFQIQVQVQVVVLCSSSLCNCNPLMLQSMRKSKQTGRLRPRPPSSCPPCCPTQSDMPTRICPPARSAQFCLTFSSLPCSVKICPADHGKARMLVWATHQWTSEGQEKDWRRNSHMIRSQSNNFWK